MSKDDTVRVVRRRSHSEGSLRAQGLVTQTAERHAYNSTSQVASGTIYVMLLPVAERDVITNLALLNGAAGVQGSSSPVAKVGLYDAAGNQLAASADLGTTFQSVGVNLCPLATPYAVGDDIAQVGGIYAALLVSSWTTQPTFVRQATIGALANPVGTGMRPFATGGTGQTTLPTTIAITTGTPFGFWVGAT